ncbi:MAG: hypothetical protein QOG63_2985 [Thermoleophilaceae bacterium]|nr:hypothetical protein [Thermoleophilaceae bacterium]
MGRIRRVAALAIAIAALAPAGAQAWMPKPVEFTRAVHQHGATTTLHTARRFDLAGASWRGERDVKVELRVRKADGSWSRWGEAGAGDDGPDAAPSTRRTVGAPVWTGGVKTIQVRADRPVEHLRLRFVNTTGSATAKQRERTRALTAKRGRFGKLTAASPVTNAPAPSIVPRSSWGASRCKPRDTPSYGDVRVAYVHHTVSVNGYSRSQSASMVLGICLFHRNGNGWDDMGYNFLVDRYGTVFEGRAGGVDAPVLGAQAGGFNSESTGVAMIGNYTGSAPPRVAMKSLARLLAWKLSLHGVPATGHVKVTSAGGSSTGYAAGQKVRVNRISGHRDVDQTACPGAALYSRLPALRREVKRLEGATSRLSLAPASGQVAYGSGPTVTGSLSVPAGAGPAGAPIELRALTGTGPERLLTTTTAAEDGSWSAQLPATTAPELVRAVFRGDGGRPGVVSRPSFFALRR